MRSPLKVLSLALVVAFSSAATQAQDATTASSGGVAPAAKPQSPPSSPVPPAPAAPAAPAESAAPAAEGSETVAPATEAASPGGEKAAPESVTTATKKDKPASTKESGRILKRLYAVFEIEQNGQPLGSIKAVLYPDKAPKTVENFVGLVEGTKTFIEFDSAKGAKGSNAQRPFYDGLTFHRVVPEYIIQGGCPLGTGKGGPGYFIPDEIRGDLRHDSAGVLSMANTGRRGTGGSQFFITLKGPLRHLDGKFTIFGRVVSGLDVAQKIAAVKRNPINERPIDPVIIKSVKILREYAN